MDGPPVITLADASVGYGTEVVLHGLTFAVNQGEIFIIAGGSGCGKSTLLKTFITLLQPLAGEITVDGTPLRSASDDAVGGLRRRIGVMYQSGALFGGLSLLENVRLPLEEFTSLSGDALDAVAYAKLALVGLAGDANKLPSTISGGMQKRVAVARALALDPPIVFLDEPTAGLDPSTSAAFDEMIVDLNKLLGTTFVVVTHELPSIFRIAHRMVILDHACAGVGGIGSPQALRDECRVEAVQAFLNRRPVRAAQ